MSAPLVSVTRGKVSLNLSSELCRDIAEAVSAKDATGQTPHGWPELIEPFFRLLHTALEYQSAVPEADLADLLHLK